MAAWEEEKPLWRIGEEGEDEEEESSDDDGQPIGMRKRPAYSRIVDSSDEEGAHTDSPCNKQQKS